MIQFKNAARTAAIGFLPALIVLLAGVGWVGSERAIHPAARHYAATLADYPDLHPSEVRFQSRTASRLQPLSSLGRAAL